MGEVAKNRRNYYRILHVQPDAPAAIIKSSYRALMLKLKMHPDHVGEHWTAKLINEAYGVLSDPDRRAEYDRDLSVSPSSGRVRHHAEGPAAPGDVPRCVFCGTPVPGDPPNREDCGACSSPLSFAAKLDIGSPDQRLADRISLGGDLSYFTEWLQKRPHAGALEDLSPNGLRFAGRSEVFEHQILKIVSERLLATARVVYCRPQRKGRFLYAIGADFYTLRFRRPTGTFISTQA